MRSSEGTPGGRKWEWLSTPESIAAGRPSVSGIAETLIAILAYWWVAIEFGTYILLVVSAVVAPLVLLRSDQSVALGVQLFNEWERTRWKDGEGVGLSKKQRRVVGVIFASAAAVGALVGHFLALHFLVHSTSWRAVTGGFAFALGVTGVVGAPAGAIAGAIAGAGGMGPMLGMWATLLVPFAVAAGIGAAGESLLTGAGAFACAGVITTSVIAVRPVATEIAGAKALGGAVARAGPIRIVLTLPMSLGVGFGVFVVSLAIRLWASLRYFYAGWLALPHNFRRLVICTSPRQVPELVPGLDPSDTQFTFGWALGQFHAHRKEKQLANWFFAYLYLLPLMVVWFLPGWLYRVSLKSTAWFWWPLSFLGNELARAKDPTLMQWKVMGSLWAKATICTAILTVIGFFAVNIMWTDLIHRRNPLLTVFGYFMFVDWSRYPWQLLLLFGALISLAVVFLLNDASGERAHAARIENLPLLTRAERKFRLAEILLRFRFLFMLVFWLLVGAHTLLYFNSLRCWVDIKPTVELWAKSVYGERMPQRQCIRQE